LYDRYTALENVYELAKNANAILTERLKTASKVEL